MVGQTNSRKIPTRGIYYRSFSCQSTAATQYADRKCSKVAECEDDEYEAQPPTPTTDRQCATPTVRDHEKER